MSPISLDCVRRLGAEHAVASIVKISQPVILGAATNGQTMPLPKPFPRTWRPYKCASVIGYMRHPGYSKYPDHYIRAFNLIEKDMSALFYFIEPDDINELTYSHRIHELFMRTCIEIEANFKAILFENGADEPRFGFNMSHYKKINRTHKLSEYEVTIVEWARGRLRVRRPFEAWDNHQGLYWYQSYNSAKHDRQNEFMKSNLRNLTDAICGLAALIGSQFRDYKSLEVGGAVEAIDQIDGLDKYSISDLLLLKYPSTWRDDELYSFNWNALQATEFPFDRIIF